MRIIMLLSLLLTTPAMALTFTSADQQSALAVHGKFKYQVGALGYQWQDASKAQAVGGSDQFSLSMAGAHQLNQTVTLIAEMSWDILSDSAFGDQLYADQAWLGVRINNRLDITVGRSDSPFTQITDITDVFNIFGGHGYRYQDSTLDDQLKLSYYHDKLDIRASYAVNDNNKQYNNLDTKSQQGFSAGYTADNGIGAVFAYENKQSADVHSDIRSMAVGLNYTSQTGVYIGVTRGQADYQRTWNVRQLNYWESVVSYSMDKLALGIGYNRLSIEKPNHATWVSEYIIAAEYYLIPQAKIYAELLLNDMPDTDNLYGVGMEYYF